MRDDWGTWGWRGVGLAGSVRKVGGPICIRPLAAFEAVLSGSATIAASIISIDLNAWRQKGSASPRSCRAPR